MSETPVYESGSPEWWISQLEPKLKARRKHMETMEAYYRGDHPLPFLTKAHEAKMIGEFRGLLEDSKANFMRLVIDACEERMQVEGFRLSAESSELSDEETWKIWQANNMDAESQTAFTEMMVKGVSYLSVWEADKPDDYPLIAIEDPLQTIVGYEPGSNFRRRAAALKVWCDEFTGDRRANVYLPQGIYKFRASDSQLEHDHQVAANGSLEKAKARWEPLEAPNDFVYNPVGIVPIVPLRNRPRLLCEGESELSDLTAIQDSINAFLFLLALGGYFGAHKQRWATGVKLFENQDGQPVEPFDVAIDKLWIAERDEESDVEPKFGEFDQTNLEGYISAIDQKTQHIAVVSRTPRHYLLPEGQEPSGDSIRSAEAGLVKKTHRKNRTTGEGLEEALKLARRFQGKGDTPVDSEIVWKDPETRTVAETTDAAIKRYSGGLIPLDVALEDMGYSQTQIRRIMAGHMKDALMAALNPAPPAPPAPADQPVVA